MKKILSKVFDDSFTEVEYFSLSLAGWLFPVFTWSIIYLLSNLLLRKTFGMVISAILLILPFFWIRFKKPSLLVVGLILFLLASIFVRLAFLQQTFLPAYFDSAEHYLNIQHLINGYQIKSFSIFSTNYYHLGYHFLSAALIHLFQFNIADFMLVFGQVALAVLPISFFFLLKQITGSNAVAFFTCLVAGFGFHIPAHIINWGKYPALLSLVGIQFAFCLGYLRYKSNLSSNRKTTLNFLLVASIFITTLIHSRTLIVFAIFIATFFIIILLKGISNRFYSSIFIFILIVLGIEIFYVHQSPVLFPLFERYFQKDIWILVFILLLAFFSIKTYPYLTLFLLISLFFFILFLFLPVSLLNYGTQTLLDRPFVQMLVYFPLSVLAGLGFAGLHQMISNFSYRSLIVFALFGFIVLNANFNYDFYPSPCCQLVNQDDILAIDWIEKNIQVNEMILIAATQLYVTAYEESTRAAVDAGIWVTPLTGRETPAQFTSIDFAANETLEFFCIEEVKYIYLGSMPASFKQSQLASHPNWYQPVFVLPKAQVYQVIGCD